MKKVMENEHKMPIEIMALTIIFIDLIFFFFFFFLDYLIASKYINQKRVNDDSMLGDFERFNNGFQLID